MENSVASTADKISNHIHDDLAFSILSKLPIKSLKRFGCVRKSWVNILEDYYFISIYRKNIISKNHFDFEDRSYLIRHHAIVEHFKFQTSFYFLSGERFENKIKLNYSSFPFEDDGREFNVVGSRSINGILGICTRGGYMSHFALWNPTINEFKVIPHSPVESFSYRRTTNFFFGFGYDHVRDDYKVIQLVDFDQLSDYDIEYLGLKEEDVPWEDLSYGHVWEIYSLKRNSWRELDTNFVIPTVYYNDILRFYTDGMCHWWYESNNYSNETCCLVSFDLSDEVIFTTPLPPDNNDNIDGKWVHMVMLINSSIALISYYEETTIFHISFLGEIGVKESWIKLFIVGPFTCIAHPIKAGKKGDIFFRKNDGELICFDLDTHTIDELGFEEFPSQIIIYNKSLLSIRGINN